MLGSPSDRAAGGGREGVSAVGRGSVVEATRLGERARGKLIRLVSDDHPDPDRWIARLKSLSDLENAPVFSAAVRVLFHLDLHDADAMRLLAAVLAHREHLARSLGRDPGLRVAAMDYLSNVERHYQNPKIVEMREYEETERSARTDAVTGLANRRVFQEVLDREVRRSRRYRWPLTILMLDLDHFKQVNDAFGHLLGDLVLERAGGVLRHAVREADLACRYGGEEFSVILPETDRLGGFVVAERIRRRVEDAFRDRSVSGHEVPMTISSGLATYPEDGLHDADLIARADEALYLAKRGGRNRVCIHHREKRSALRFPVRPSTTVCVLPDRSVEAHAVDLSRSGILLEFDNPPRVADPVALRLERTGPRSFEDACEVSGRIVRLAPPAAGEQRVRAGVAFDAPLPEERVLARVLLTRAPARLQRGGAR
jgi:diguanylate cyclase (GGDEF)-like protein